MTLCTPSSYYKGAGFSRASPFISFTKIMYAIYEAWIRRETYYRHDTRLMYCDTVNAVVKAKVEETTGAKGIKLIRYMENCPLLNELYTPNPVPLSKEP
jgi:hypothetical protein